MYLYGILIYVYVVFFFFFNDTATTEIYTLSLHDALPIFCDRAQLICFLESHDAGKRDHKIEFDCSLGQIHAAAEAMKHSSSLDRKSTRLNSSHANISYAVFCLKKKKNNNMTFNIPVHYSI